MKCKCFSSTVRSNWNEVWKKCCEAIFLSVLRDGANGPESYVTILANRAFSTIALKQKLFV